MRSSSKDYGPEGSCGSESGSMSHTSSSSGTFSGKLKKFHIFLSKGNRVKKKEGKRGYEIYFKIGYEESFETESEMSDIDEEAYNADFENTMDFGVDNFVIGIFSFFLYIPFFLSFL